MRTVGAVKTLFLAVKDLRFSAEDEVGFMQKREVGFIQDCSFLRQGVPHKAYLGLDSLALLRGACEVWGCAEGKSDIAGGLDGSMRRAAISVRGYMGVVWL